MTTDLAQKEGFWYRVGTQDTLSIADTRKLFRHPCAPEPLDVVLDLGAHIGTFTRRALDRGAEFVRAVEPEPANCDLFLKNVTYTADRWDLWQGAAAKTDTGRVDLYLNHNKGTDSHTIQPIRGREVISVPAWTLQQLCLDFEPTFVKIDIEGGEFSLDIVDSFPASADRLFIEFHFFRKKGDRERSATLREQIIHELGFEPVWESRWTPNAWWAEAMFRR